ncbi:MAG: right-handed parallel beta-helix repeat-containing protein [Chloroflexi bacterium]|nr:right-handed parallel beta-helix repeat-containing protein [Chloroflexota bacterium]
MIKTVYRITSIIIALTMIFGIYTSAHASFEPAAVRAQSQAVLAAQTIYYVSATGNDANPGTSSAPFKTIQKAVNTAAAGDTVTVLAGNYAERVTVNRAVVLQAQGTVNMQGFVVSADYVTIKGFTVTTFADLAVGILVNKGGWCDIENNTVQYSTMGGISLQGLPANPSATHDCIVKNNVLYRNGIFGLEIMGQNHLVEGNDISQTIQNNPCNVTYAGATWLDANGILFHGSGHVFRNNKIHDIPFGPEGYTQGTPCSLASLQNLSNDYISDSHTDCFQTFAGDKIAGHDILFDGNSCINVTSSLNLNVAARAFQVEGGAYNLTFINNVVNTNGIANINGARDIRFENNTFVGNPDFAYSTGIYLTNATNVKIRNNVFAYQENGVGSIWPDSISKSSLTAGYNCVYRAGGPPARSPDPGDVWGLNPLFVNMAAKNFRLQSASPCIDKGFNSGIPNDFDGSLRPQGAGFDIGAFEFAAASSILPTFTSTPIPLTATPTASPAPVLPTFTPTPISLTATPTASPAPVLPTFTSTPIPLTTTPTASPAPVLPTATLTSSQPTATSQATTQPPVSETTYDDTYRFFKFSSFWPLVSNSQAYLGKYKYTGTKATSVTLSFTGQSFSVLYAAGPSYGSMDIYIDNQLAGSLNQQSPDLRFQQRWDYPGKLVYGKHTLKLVFTGPVNTMGTLDAVIVR